MKEISEYTLKECLEEVEMLHGGYGFRDPEKLADRIHNLTRWIPVSERMPENLKVVLCMTHHGRYMVSGYCRDTAQDETWFVSRFVAWKRITPPEDK
jgi:hypothetical protein